METLALHGGRRAVDVVGPHFVWPRIDDELRQVVISQLESNLSIAGSSGVFGEFEAVFSKYHDRRYGILYNSGTSALFSAFVSLELKPGDNVIVPDYTFFATATPLAYFPVDIRFADCGQSGNISLESIIELADPSTRAVVITHMWGIPCDVDLISEFCKARGIALIEDCSHAHGARLDGTLCGSFGDIAIWSLQGQKIVSGGEGGILLTDSLQYYELAVLAGHFGPRTKELISESSRFRGFRNTGFGLKLRAHPIAIAIAKQQFSHLESFLAVKRRNAEKFYSLLSNYNFISLPDISRRNPSWYSFTFRVSDKASRFSAADFYKALQAEGCIEIDQPSSTRNISTYEIFFEGRRSNGMVACSSNVHQSRPQAAAYYREALKLPMWAFDGDSGIVDLYLSALEKLCDHVARRGGV